MAKTICLVDDETEILAEMKEWLGDLGYHVVTSEGGEEALQKIDKLNPHLVILDVIMPKVDGFEVLSRIRRNAKTSTVPVIMLTAKKETSSIMQAQELRAEDYMTKPFDSAELLRSIRRYIA